MSGPVGGVGIHKDPLEFLDFKDCLHVGSVTCHYVIA